MFDTKHKSIQEAMRTIYLSEARANDDALACDELDEAQSCIKQAIRHIESADNYCSANDSSKLADRLIELLKDAVGYPNGPYDEQPMYSIEALKNRITGADRADEEEEDKIVDDYDPFAIEEPVYRESAEAGHIEEGLFGGKTIKVGSTVTLLALDGSEEELEGTLIGDSDKDNPAGRRGRWDPKNPMHKALLGKKKGDNVTVRRDSVSKTYNITKVK